MTLASPLHNQRGATLMVVLVMMVVMGLSAGVAGTAWRDIMQKEREEELFFRGDQYRRAVESYYKGKGMQQAAGSVAKGAYPPRLEDLLKDPRSAQTVRHLRRLYKDPMTRDPETGQEQDFELVKEGGEVTGLPGGAQKLGGIRGVRSTSDLTPFKQDRFPKLYEKFIGVSSYQQWEFIYEPQREQPPGGPPVPKPGGP
jgi:type II secretory pathway pseudopilin PulG